ncbi:MAG: hypothetical protein K2I36_02910 [Ureaplasma sp.]|nr:hypothetical protein [Ureaplasma sp.]
MQKINSIQKSTLISGASTKNNLWSKIAFSSVLINTSIGLVTNVLNILNSTKQKPLYEEEISAKLYTNLNDNLNIKFF